MRRTDGKAAETGISVTDRAGAPLGWSAEERDALGTVRGYTMFDDSVKPDTGREPIGDPLPRRSKPRRPRAIHDGGTIRNVPESLLHGPARWALVALAHYSNIWVHSPLGKEPDEFKIWIEALAQTRAGHDGYVWLEEWCERWRAYYRLLLLPDAPR